MTTCQDVLADPCLQDMPYKIELSAEGKIEMSPSGNKHAVMQMKIAAELMARPGGQVLGECGIQTADGVRVPDVMWASDMYMAGSLPDPLAQAPETASRSFRRRTARGRSPTRWACTCRQGRKRCGSSRSTANGRCTDEAASAARSGA